MRLLYRRKKVGRREGGTRKRLASRFPRVLLSPDRCRPFSRRGFHAPEIKLQAVSSSCGFLHASRRTRGRARQHGPMGRTVKPDPLRPVTRAVWSVHRNRAEALLLLKTPLGHGSLIWAEAPHSRAGVSLLMEITSGSWVVRIISGPLLGCLLILTGPHRSPPIPLDHLKDSSEGISGGRGGEKESLPNPYYFPGRELPGPPQEPPNSLEP